jgi:hypothetical protein
VGTLRCGAAVGPFSAEPGRGTVPAASVTPEQRSSTGAADRWTVSHTGRKGTFDPGGGQGADSHW